MAYGDNRSETISDTFDSSISANWSNGEGDWDTFTWVSGGHVHGTGGGGDDSGMRYNATQPADNQYAQTTCGAANMNADDSAQGALLRMATGTDESAYWCVINHMGPPNQYEIRETDSSFGLSTLASGSSGVNALTNGDILTGEAEGTTLRCGSDESGADSEEVSTTDATLTSGYVGMWREHSGNSGVNDRSQMTAFNAGDLGAVEFETEAYRFRNDDGSETTATWKAAQDTDITIGKGENFRLRVLTNVNSVDPPTVTRTLQYKRDDEGDSEWRDV